jgi:WD40 repeat protein/serine/threonine protein kinase
MIHTDRNLLLGILAVQMNFVSRDALIAGMGAWVLAKHRSLGRILVEQGALSAGRHEMLERLVDEHLAVIEGDAEKSLAAAVGLGAVHDCGGNFPPTEPEPLAEADVDTRTPLWPDVEATLPLDPNLAAEALRFTPLRPHARGGLGLVWVALDRELNREVALKEMRPEQADDLTSRTRFLLEAEVTGRLEHPGVVPVYGLGCNAEGRPFYAMRFVRGRSLKEEIARFHGDEAGTRGDRRPWNLGLRALLNRFIAVCNVVEYAHSRGVVHRDIKPSNVLLGPYGETLVVDWGLAKVVGRDEAADKSALAEATLRPASQTGSSETLPGLALGTPAYMSPEQAEGQRDNIGPVSDVYSLGATLYSLLTGRLPFPDSDVVIVLRRVRGGELLPPRQVNRRVPAGLEAACLKAMAYRPEDRYPSARALANDLEHWLADEPISVYREPLSTRLTRWGRRHRTLATGIGVLLITAVIGLGLGTLLLGRANERIANQRALAEVQRGLAELKTREADEKARALEHQLYIHRVNLAQSEALNDIIAAGRLLDQCPPVARGWEWDYVKRLCHLERRTLRGHTRSVNAVAFSRDGRRVVSGAGDRYYGALGTHDAELTLWDAESGRPIQQLKGLKGAVFSVAFSPDGRLIAAGSGFRSSTNIQEGRLSVWDAESGRLLYERPEAGLNVLSVAFSPDGRLIAAGYGRYSSTEPGRLKIWEAAGGKEVHAITSPPGGVNSVAFSPDSRRVAMACSEVVELWDVAGPRAGKVRTLPGHTSWIYAVAFSRDGTRLATGGWDKTLRIWDLTGGAPPLIAEEHDSFITSLAFSPDGRRLASSDEGHNVQVLDTVTGRVVSSLRGHALGVVGLAYSTDGRSLATASEDKTVKLWDVATDYPIAFRDHKGWVTSLAFSKDGRRVLSGSGDRTLRIWDPATGRCQQTLGKHGEWILAAAFSPDGRYVASTSLDYDIRLWDLASEPSTYKSLGPSQNFPTCLAFSPDGRRLAVGSGAGNSMLDQTGVVRIWEVPSGRELRTYRGHPGGISSLVFSPDGATIVSVGGDPRVPRAEAKVWEAATGRDLRDLVGHQKPIYAVAYSRDGARLATAGQDETVRLWEAASGRLLRTLDGHSQEVHSVAFSPDGTRLATGAFDDVIKLWDVASGDEVLSLRGHSAGVVSLAFSPDGRRLVSGSVDWTARVWDATPLDDPSRDGPP